MSKRLINTLNLAEIELLLEHEMHKETNDTNPVCALIHVFRD
jgi:hypothetical protein